MKQYDVIALGELLIDFATTGVSEAGNPVLEANPGGAPCNVLSMLANLNKKVGFIGKVGKDFLGEFLAGEVTKQGIDITGLSRDEKIPTTLAFVNNAPDGERSFSFYRSPGADMMLRKEDIDFSLLDNTTVFHFGTLSMTDPEVEAATRAAIDYAKSKGCILSFDPNLRPPLWNDLDRAKAMMEAGMEVCDILKISDNEIQFVTGVDDIDEGIKIIKEKYNPTLLCATLGKDGSIVVYKDMWVRCDGFKMETCVDTTGAGDTFMACAINYVLEHGMDDLSEDKLKEMLRFANAAAAIITTRVGALKSMPVRAEVEALLNR